MTASSDALDALLDAVSVLSCDEMNEACAAASLNSKHPAGMFGVVDEDGVCAYFPEARDAFYYRLDLINRRLNT